MKTLRIALVDCGQPAHVARGILDLVKDRYDIKLTQARDAEYVIHSCMGYEVLKYEGVRIFVAEFHRLDFLWCKPFFKTASRVFEKILQTHVCVHAHPNNGRGSIKKGDIEIPLNMEFTFARQDRIGKHDYTKTFPHPLDIDNVDLKPPLVLPSCWFGGCD